MGEPVPLKEFIEARFHAHEAVHAEEYKARAETARRLDTRLEALNELRTEVMTDRSRLVNREMFDAKMEALNDRIDTLSDQIVLWKGRDQGLSLAGQVIMGLGGIAAAVLAVFFAFN